MLAICERVAVLYGPQFLSLLKDSTAFPDGLPVAEVLNQPLWTAGVIQTPFVRLAEVGRYTVGFLMYFKLILFLSPYQNDDTDSLLSYCMKSGAIDSTIWVQTLSALATSGSSSKKNQSISLLLEHLKHTEGSTPHPLTIIRLLGNAPMVPGQESITLGSVKVGEIPQ